MKRASQISQNKFAMVGVGLVVMLSLGVFATMACQPVQAHCNYGTNTAAAAYGPSQQLADRYFTYHPDQVTQDIASGKQAILYFHAPWCTTCSGFHQELLTRSNELPDNLVVYQVDYDHDTAMKARYAVPIQHAMILLDENQDTAEMWIGGSFDQLLDSLR